MSFRSIRFVEILIVLASTALTIVMLGCNGPPTASQIKIGNDTAELPKAGHYNAKYEYTNAKTGEHRLLEIKDATVDPAAALQANVEVEAKRWDAFKSLTDRISIPGVTTTAPAAPSTGPPK